MAEEENGNKALTTAAYGGSVLGLAGAGAAIGSFIPGVGTFIGFGIGLILAGAGAIAIGVNKNRDED
jgi:hypothetical protein